MKIEPKAFQDALGARLSGDAVFWGFWEPFGSPRNLENRAPATMRAQFRLFTPTTPGGRKSTPFWCKIEAKCLPAGVQMASQAVFHKAAILVLISNLIFMNCRPPGGGGRGWLNGI